MKIILKGKTNDLNLKESHAVFIVSIDVLSGWKDRIATSKFEAENFAEIANTLSAAFHTVTIIIADSLQRHNLMLDNSTTEEQAGILARKMGQEWLERNNPQDKIKNLQQIQRWDDWLQTNEYAKLKIEFENYYNDDSKDNACKAAINRSAEGFLKRRLNGQNTISENLKLTAYEYAKEEAIITALWKQEGFNFHLYPGKLNAGIYYSLKKFVHNQHPNLLIPLMVSIEFQKKHIAILGEQYAKPISLSLKDRLLLYQNSGLQYGQAAKKASDLSPQIEGLADLIANQINNNIQLLLACNQLSVEDYPLFLNHILKRLSLDSMNNKPSEVNGEIKIETFFKNSI